ncbi:MAG: class I SAM-dependent methyltransferase [Solirubrobacteraceae bacterium]
MELEEDSFWFRARSRLILDALKAEFPRARSLLEIGCGTGYVLNGIHGALPDIELTGADLYVQGLRHAQRRVPSAQVVQCDAERLPFADAFDVVAAFDVLEHVDDDVGVLADLRRAVRSDGGLMVTVPQHRWLWSPADDFAYHRRRYVRRELIAKVQGVGFEPVRVTSFVFSLLPLMFASRLRDRHADEPYDPVREHQQSIRLGPLLERILGIEARLIRRGVSLPAGGSLFMVARPV